MVSRVNLFWFGAGLLLTVFGANEVVAYHLARVPRWLGGPLAYGGAWVAVALGVFVVWAYGFEEPREEEPAVDAKSEDDAEKPAKGDDDDADQATKPAQGDGDDAKNDAEAEESPASDDKPKKAE